MPSNTVLNTEDRRETAETAWWVKRRIKECYNTAMVRKSKLGKITMQVGAEPTESDIVVGNVFARLGFDIEFIVASRKYLIHTPDINMDGLAWEIKCPTSKKMDKFRQNISGALEQSQNIIIGTFRTKTRDEKIIKFIADYLKEHKKVKRLKVVTKTHQVLDLR